MISISPIWLAVPIAAVKMGCPRTDRRVPAKRAALLVKILVLLLALASQLALRCAHRLGRKSAVPRAFASVSLPPDCPLAN